MPSRPSVRSFVARPSSIRALGLAAALAAVPLLVPIPAAGSVTDPAGNGVAKDRGFTIVPPWGRGKTFRMTCGYGCFRHDNVGTQDHFALDFPMQSGEPLFPVAPGKVLLSEDLGGGWEPYGNSVFIQHANGYQSFYAHLDQLDVVAGQEVDIDTQIGTAGRSGSGGGSVHLHFVLYKNAVVAGSPGARGPSGGSAVVPEPLASCTMSNGGDCESLVNYEYMRRDDYGIDAVVHPDGSLELFTCGRTSRNLLQRRRSAAGVWQGWVNLGGTCGSSPTGARDSAGRIYAFVRGTDGNLYYRRRNTTTGGWSAWGSLPGPVLGRPGAALDTVSGALRVFSRRASDDALQYASQSGTGFGSWSSLGGILTNSPVAGTRAGGRVDAFVSGIDYTLWKQPAQGNGSFGSGGWTSQGVKIEGDAALVTEGSLEWTVRTTGDRIVNQPNQDVTSGTHPPAAARNQSGLLHFFSRNRSTSAVDYRFEFSWGGYGSGSFGGHGTSEIEAVRAGNQDRILMFTWGTGGLYYREQSWANATTQWGGWVDLQVPN